MRYLTQEHCLLVPKQFRPVVSGSRTLLGLQLLSRQLSAITKHFCQALTAQSNRLAWYNQTAELVPDAL